MTATYDHATPADAATAAAGEEPEHLRADQAGADAAVLVMGRQITAGWSWGNVQRYHDDEVARQLTDATTAEGKQFVTGYAETGDSMLTELAMGRGDRNPEFDRRAEALGLPGRMGDIEAGG
jgi:hypothetical protein